MTENLYLADPTLREAEARVITAGPDGIVLDRSPFYPRAGGQPGDAGTLTWAGGEVAIAEAVKGAEGVVLHPAAAGAALPAPGQVVTARIDWARRFAHMRMHTAMHLLCAVLPGAGVTGGQVGAERSRLDFDLPDPPPREAIEAALNALIAADHPVATLWVEESVLDTSPDLVRTLSVKPPRGTGRLRLVRIGEPAAPVDLQPCGGTHVAHTGQIGVVSVLKIENKGRQNRRISIALAG